MKVSLIQTNSQDNKENNIEKTINLMNQCLVDNPDIICLSEKFLYWGEDRVVETTNSPTIKLFQEFAKTNKVNIILGSIEFSTNEKNKTTNTSLVINRNGSIVFKYDKIYMYTVDRDDLKIDEEYDTLRGNKIGLFELDGVKIGLGICFDVRFPEYFRELTKQGAEVIFLPSSFRKTTGLIAWDILPNARAIENQVYFCACNQTGGEGLKARCGNSKVISYNGEIICSLNEDEGYLSTNLDIEALRTFRREIPVSKQIIDFFK